MTGRHALAQTTDVLARPTLQSAPPRIGPPPSADEPYPAWLTHATCPASVNRQSPQTCPTLSGRHVLTDHLRGQNKDLFDHRTAIIQHFFEPAVI